MSGYAVITQNDESPWDDIKGELYHYPSRYKQILTPGCKVIYYKGGMKNKTFLKERLSKDPHYFGVGIIGTSVADSSSSKKDYYCRILEYKEFTEAIPNKANGEYFEIIPQSKKSNYWRDGVREITKDVYDQILRCSSLRECKFKLPKITDDLESYRPTEGTKKQRYTTYYERNPIYRQQALEFHGLTCMGCGFNFEEAYGDWGKGFIHVHHNKPVSETGPTEINPEKDMSVLCPNCHAMVHRKKDRTLSLDELRELMTAF